ncbi:Ig-like domain-containing protein, partial [Dyella flagellata]
EWFGDDSFSYDVNDSEAQSNIATVHIKVVPMPTAENARFRVDSDGTVRIDLRCLVDDPDENAEAKLAINVNAPGHGQLIHQEDGVYLYKPQSGFSGTDAFTYTVSDGVNAATASISLDVDNDDGEDDDCGYSQTIMIQASMGQAFNGTDSYGYIVVNQGLRKDGDDDDSRQQVSWDNDDDAPGGHSQLIDSDWWNALVAEPLLGAGDLSERSGLVIKRVN